MKRILSVLLALSLCFALGCSESKNQSAVTVTPTAAPTAVPAPTPQEGLSGLSFPFMENRFALRRIEKQTLPSGQVEYSVQFVLEKDDMSPQFSTLYDTSTEAGALYGLHLLAQNGETIDPYTFLFSQITEMEGYALLADYSFILDADQTLPDQAELYVIGGDERQIVDLSAVIASERVSDSVPTPDPSMRQKKTGLQYGFRSGTAVLYTVSEYNEDGLVTRSTPYSNGTAESEHSEYEYRDGLLTTKTNYLKLTVSSREVYEYIWPGLLTARTVYSGYTGEKTAWETFEYDENLQLVSHMRNQNGDGSQEGERYSYTDNEDGLTDHYVCRGNGYQTTYYLTWNDERQLTSKKTQSDDNIYMESYFYNGDLLVKTIMSHEDAIPNEPHDWITYSYRDDGTLLEKRIHDRSYSTTDYTDSVEYYDADGILLLRIEYAPSGEVDEKWELVREYDQYGRVIRETEIENGTDILARADYSYHY